MSWLRFFRRSQADAELREEIDAYLAEETAENIARGVKPEEARRRARIMLGNPRSVRETLWQQNTVSLVDALGRELKFATRTLARSPGFSLIAVIVMALCIGATTSLFTVVRSVLLRPLPFRDPGRLVMLFEHPRNARSNREGFSYNPVSPADYFDWRAQTHGFEDMAAWRWSRFNLTGERGELPELVIACGGSWNLFPLLGVQAAIGRTFSHVVARLRPDVSLASAMSQVGAVQYRLHLQYLNAPVAEDVASKTINDDLARDVKKPLLILMCAVGCMLLIGCLNVANLLVARGAARQKEVAIRGALGAQRLALIRAQLTESLLICLAGGASGVLLSLAATKWLSGAWQDLPNAEVIRVDGVVLGFACALVFLAALLAGLLPAISSTGKAAFAALQASSRTTSGNLSRAALRKTLLTVEIAVTVVLLIGAGLLLRSFVRLRGADVGCVTNNVLTLDVNLPARKYGSPQRVNAFNETLLEKLRAMPGVRAVALGSNLPGEGFGSDDDFTIKEHPPLKPGEGIPDALARWADPGYFSALQIPLLSGRFFTSDDRLDRARKIVVSSLFARQYFPGENPIGRTILVLDQNNADYEIIGVVGDTPWQVGQPIRPIMYFPILGGGSEDGQSLAIRTDSDPLAMSVPVQKQIATLDPELPVSNVQTMQQAIADSLGNARFSAALVLGFAVLSLVLASVGLYGVLSYLMAQRTTELGIRMALGAQRDQLLRLMLFDGLRPAIIGLAIGSAGSAGITQLIRSMLYDTRPLDPAVYIAVIFTLLMVATLACMIPAWRASRLDPMHALRAE